MKKLNVNVHTGIDHNRDVETITIDNYEDLSNHIESLSKYDGIWLVTSNGAYKEIIITENINTVLTCLRNSIFELGKGKEDDFHIFLNDTFESAYSVALNMREPHPKCYD